MNKERHSDYIERMKKNIELAQHLERMSFRLTQIRDENIKLESRRIILSQELWGAKSIYGMPSNKEIEQPLLYRLYPDMIGDPAFEKLNDTRKRLSQYSETWIAALRLNNEIYNLTERMARRSTNAEEYEDILNGKHNCQIEAEQFINQVSKESRISA